MPTGVYLATYRFGPLYRRLVCGLIGLRDCVGNLHNQFDCRTRSLVSCLSRSLLRSLHRDPRTLGVVFYLRPLLRWLASFGSAILLMIAFTFVFQLVFTLLAGW